LSAKLSDWTGRRWIVTVSRAGGGATMREAREDTRAKLKAEARVDPNVAAVLDAFPGAEIVNVTVRTPPAEPDIDAPDDDDA